VNRALDLVSGPKLGLVVGEESETVCEGMDIPALLDLLRQRRAELELLVLVGERLAPWADELGAMYARDLAAGQEQAMTCPVERLLLCVKCFR